MIIDQNDQLQDTVRTIRDDQRGIICTRLSRNDLVSILKIDPTQLKISPYNLYLFLLGLETPKINIAPPDVTASYRKLRLKQKLIYATISIALLSAVAVAYNFWRAAQTKSLTAVTVQQIANINAEYEQASRSFPSSPTSAENLRKGTQLAEQLQRQSISPDNYLRVMSRALEPSPEIVVLESSWQIGSNQDPTNRSHSSALPPNNVLNDSNLITESAQLAGYVQDFKGDYRRAIASINALVERLRADASVDHVKIMQLPLNLNPTLSLSGNTTENPSQTNQAEFKLQLGLKRQL